MSSGKKKYIFEELHDPQLIYDFIYQFSVKMTGTYLQQGGDEYGEIHEFGDITQFCIKFQVTGVA